MSRRNKCLTFYVTYNELLRFGKRVDKSKKNKTNFILDTFGVEPCQIGSSKGWNYELITETDNWWDIRRYPVAIYMTPKEKALLIERLMNVDGSNVRDKIFNHLNIKLDKVGKKTDCSIYFGKSKREGK